MYSKLKKLGNKAFTTEQALKKGLSKTALSRLVESGNIERLTRGVYIVSDIEDTSSPYSDNEIVYIAATLRCGKPSVICLLSALEHYNLTDIITKQTWVMVPESKRVRSPQLKIIRTRRPYWNHGIIKERDYWITSIERTIIDSFVYAKLIGKNTAIEALKRAIKQNVRPKDIIDLANKLKVIHRIIPYIEMVI